MIQEQHSERWLHQTNMYLGDMALFRNSQIFKNTTLWKFQPTPDLPKVPKVPGYKWYLDVYGLDLERNLPHMKAEITSTLGKIIKLDSTKKVYSL